LHVALLKNNTNPIHSINATNQLRENRSEGILQSVGAQIQLTRRNTNPPKINRGSYPLQPIVRKTGQACPGGIAGWM
jgi:hypothetical protein